MSYQIINKLINIFDPELSHSLAIFFLKHFFWSNRADEDDAILSVKVFGKEFKNPIGLAAGFDKNADVYEKFSSLGFSFSEVGTVTPRPQVGNLKPRVFRLNEDLAVINRLGFPNEGMSKIKTKIQNKLFNGILGINIGPNKESTSKIKDYLETFKNFYDISDYICINISSPNTENLRDFHEASNLESLLSELLSLRKSLESTVPVILKISPDIEEKEIPAICNAILKYNIDGITISNTTVRLREILTNQNKNEQGGLSGVPLQDLSNNLIKKFYKIIGKKIPIIGVGGVNSGKSAYDKIRSGATLLQLYTGLVFQGPFIAKNIKKDLVFLLKQGGFKSLEEAVGVDSK